MKTRLFFFLVLALSAVQLKAQTGLTEAQDFTAKDVYGNTHNLFSYLDSGKIMVLSFFTTTCGSCNIYTPEIVKSFDDYGCNQGNVFYLGLNWGANNIGVIDFMAVHAVEFPCASGIEGLGNQINLQYEIGPHITALVIMPDRSIAAQFYGPNAWPIQDTLNALLASVGGVAQPCTVQASELENSSTAAGITVFPNPASDEISVQLNLETDGVYQLEIIDIFGELVLGKSLEYPATNQRIPVNIHALDAGAYSVRLKKAGLIIDTEKFIKVN